MAKKDLSTMSDSEIREELKRRRETDREFRVEKSKKTEGVIVVWPSTRSRFPLSAQAVTWLEVLDHEDEIREFIRAEGLAEGSSSSKKKPKKKKSGKKKKRKECFGQFDKDAGACEYCKQAVACQDETEG